MHFILRIAQWETMCARRTRRHIFLIRVTSLRMLLRNDLLLLRGKLLEASTLLPDYFVATGACAVWKLILSGIGRSLWSENFGYSATTITAFNLPASFDSCDRIYARKRHTRKFPSNWSSIQILRFYLRLVSLIFNLPLSLSLNQIPSTLAVLLCDFEPKFLVRRRRRAWWSGIETRLGFFANDFSSPCSYSHLYSRLWAVTTQWEEKSYKYA